MRTVTPLAVAAGLTLTACLVAGTVGLVTLINPPSPTTRVTTADGSEITLDWRDFPASSDPFLDPQEVLDGPRVEDVADVVDEQIAALSASLAPLTPGVEWVELNPDDEPTFYPSDGNGYGGESMHQTFYVSMTSVGELPADSEWSTLTDALDAELVHLGYGEVTWEFERAMYPGQTEAQHERDMIDQFGAIDPDEMWLWSGVADGGCLWASVLLWDKRRGAPEDVWMEETSGMEVSLGGSVISRDDEAAYAEAVAPFDGLTRPDSTTSE